MSRNPAAPMACRKSLRDCETLFRAAVRAIAFLCGRVSPTQRAAILVSLLVRGALRSRHQKTIGCVRPAARREHALRSTFPHDENAARRRRTAQEKALGHASCVSAPHTK